MLHEEETSKFDNGVRLLKKLPKACMVKFREADGTEVSWRLRGVKENGLYPVVCKKGSWYLDKCRRYPSLRITRRQMPLAPAFAMTYHAAQGQALKVGAIVDLCIGKGSNPLGSYVALTRVTDRSKLFIFADFRLNFSNKVQKRAQNYCCVSCVVRNWIGRQ